MGIGDWGLGIGDWGLGPIPNPQSPIPNPHYETQQIYLNIILFTKIKYNLFLALNIIIIILIIE